MRWLIELAAFSLLAFGLVMVALQFGALWVGHRLGQRHARRVSAGEQDPVEGVSVVVGALLGLLAFTMGLTITIAASRFEDRRRAALDEANAIGTAWLRAEAIGHPRGAEIGRLLERYTEVRIAWISAPRDSAALDRAAAETGRLQTLIWGHAAAIVRERPDPVAAGLQASLNDAFDMATTQRWAFSGQMPVELPWLLFGLTLVSVGGIGYQWGIKRRWHPAIAVLLLAAWGGCLMLIADLSNPRIGWVRVDAGPYLWTQQGFRGGVPIPPAP
ncbi:bestrophin-like domain [Falsiroseomonas oryziterrae]|uniref:bestrophin-like domain n=1 Tax=Falsiroseomonas oryziterrae TaxID=2911368 RepID=UPI001F3476A6|nr:hypothetical protein [Roseomonas sp. NPKOSM-4]